MSLPSERTMPVTTATWNAMARRWTVALPLGVALEAATPADVEELVRRHAPGSALKFVRDALRGGVDEAVAPVQHSDSTPERAGTAFRSTAGGTAG